jgi:hypothetical protein
MLLTKEKDTWQKAHYVSYSIGIDSIVMRDMATFITGIIKNVIEPINSINDMSPVSVVFRRSVKVCSLRRLSSYRENTSPWVDHKY